MLDFNYVSLIKREVQYIRLLNMCSFYFKRVNVNKLPQKRVLLFAEFRNAVVSIIQNLIVGFAVPNMHSVL